MTRRKRRRQKAGVIIDYRTFNVLLASRQVESSTNFLQADHLYIFFFRVLPTSFSLSKFLYKKFKTLFYFHDFFLKNFNFLLNKELNI